MPILLEISKLDTALLARAAQWERHREHEKEVAHEKLKPQPQPRQTNKRVGRRGVGRWERERAAPLRRGERRWHTWMCVNGAKVRVKPSLLNV